MKTKTPKNSPIAVLYTAADEIVRGTREVFTKQGHDAREIRLPILIHGTDMRITIESGPKIAARNAIENAQMSASGKPAEPTVDMTVVIQEVQTLLAEYAGELVERIESSEPGTCAEDEKALQRCFSASIGLREVERLV